MNNINFDNPWLLLIALPLLLLVCVPFFIAVNKENKNWHNIASLVIHTLMVLLIAFSAAGTTIKTSLTETHVYVVCDLSQSTNNNLDEIDEHIANIELPDNAKMGIVCFANNPVVTTPLGEKPSSIKEATTDTRLDRSGTDIVKALDYTRRLFTNNVIKRIVLITDAKESNESDANALYRTAQALKQESIQIDAIFIDSTLDGNTPEVQLQSVDAKSEVYVNRKTTANVVLQSNLNTRANMKLSRIVNGEEETLYTQTVAVNAGSTSLTLTLDTAQVGVHDYKVCLDYVEKDTNTLNNSMNFTQTVEASPKALLITGDRELAYGDKEVLESYFDEDNLTVVPQERAPFSITELCQYDEIVLSNVDVAKLSSPTMFVSNLTGVIANLGKSLLVFGELSHSGGYENAYNDLTKILPLGYGNDNHQGVLYTIVFDLSTSMRNSNKLEDAKEALRSYVGLLNENDSILFYSFNSSLDNVISTAISAEKREDVYEIIDNLSGASLDHDTHIWEFLLDIKDKLNTSYQNYQDRQIILVSDLADRGTTPNGYETKAKETINELANNDIYTNIIYLNKNETESQEVQTALTNLTPKLNALETCAVYSWPTKEGEVSAMETWKQNIADVKINRFVNVNVALRSDSVMDGVIDGTSTTLEYLGGFMRTYARPSATTVLTVSYEGRNLPLYAYRNYINGKIAVFASSLSGDWLVGWNTSSDEESIASKFFYNVLDTNVPSECNRQQFKTELDLSTASTVQVNLTPAEIKNSPSPSVTITSPDGNSVTYSSIEFTSSHYTFTFETPIVGAYKVDVKYSDLFDVYSFTYNLSFLPEYDSFVVYDSVPLIKMLSNDGQVITDGKPLVLTNDEKIVGSQIIYLAGTLLIIAVCLFAIDIIIRKIKWNDIKSLFGSINKGGKV